MYDKNSKKKKIYYAAGWFTPQQEEEHTRIYNCIKNDFDVFNPKLESLVTPGATDDFMTQTLLGNIRGIEEADLVLVIYDYKDTGTIWEAGHAYASKKPILYYAETLGEKKFNLMLAKTGNFVANMEDLVEALKKEETYTYKSVYHSYKGGVE